MITVQALGALAENELNISLMLRGRLEEPLQVLLHSKDVAEELCVELTPLLKRIRSHKRAQATPLYHTLPTLLHSCICMTSLHSP